MMSSKFHHGRFLFVFVCLAGLSVAAPAATLEVDDDGLADFKTIQQAVEAAFDGDIIVVNPGTYAGPGNCDIDLQGKAVTITGVDPLDPNIVETTVIDCGGTAKEPHRGFYVVDSSGATISGLTIINGLAPAGGGVYCLNSTLSLTHCQILGNATLGGDPSIDPNGGPGGGIYAASSALVLDGCTISGNATAAGSGVEETTKLSAGNAGHGAGLYAVDCDVEAFDCTIADNQAGDGGRGLDALSPGGNGGNGGGLYCTGDGSLSMQGSLVLRNRAGTGGSPFGTGGSGAGICCLPSVGLGLSECEVADNTAAAGGSTPQDVPGVAGASGNGGGILCYWASLQDTSIRDNATSDGESAFDGAAAGGEGGGVYCPATLELMNCSVRANRTGSGGYGNLGGGFGGNGGGVWADTLVAAGCTFAENRTGDGGALERGRKAGDAGYGGGIFAIRATLERCTVTGNATGRGALGGGEGLLEDGNGGDGGGLYCIQGILTDCLVAGNRTGEGGEFFDLGGDGRGAGIFCGEQLLTVTNCTIVENVVGDDLSEQGVPQGGGIFARGDMLLQNTIIWNNRPDQLGAYDCNDVVYCDIEEPICTDGQGNVSTAPLFIRPGSWVDVNDLSLAVAPGEPNAVWVRGLYQLQADSPCIDAGDPKYAADPNQTDLAGSPRVVHGLVDIGAYEFQDLVPVYRFWSPKTSKHFFTTSESEKAKLVDLYANVWSFEGIAYYAFARAVEPNLAPVYRFWSDKTSSHFYTISEAERDKLIAEYAEVWTFEGEVFYAYPEGRQPPGAKPVHRFWSDKSSAHFYTISEAETNKLIDEYSQVWTYEGIVWYAYEEPTTEGPVTPEPPTPPVEEPVAYEFIGGPDEASLVLQLKAYLDGKEAIIDAPELVFVPAAGRMGMVVDLASMTAILTECHLESESLEHAPTISVDDSGGTGIPVVLSAFAFFDTTTPRGAWEIDPQSLSFPAEPDDLLAGGDETFTIVGSVTVDGKKLDVELVAGATNFGTVGSAVLDTSALPDRLDIRAMPFQWSRQKQEDLLLDTTVKGQPLQLYVTSAAVQTGGLWRGTPVAPTESSAEKK